MKKVIIGSRGSALSLKQAEIIKDKLLSIEPKFTVTITTITTKGDRNMNPIPLDTVGKGWFTKEIDKSLLEGKIDLAVHSLKDLPEVLPDGLIIGAIPEREDAREVLLSKNGSLLNKLAKGAIIGTDSNRRKAQLLHMRPDLSIKSIRGNVNTRIQKLLTEQYDALILAAAGLIRLGLTDKISQYFPLTDFIPSPGQGALAVVIRKNDTAVRQLSMRINDEQSFCEITAERSFSAEIGGGCKMPVGAYATCVDGKITLHGMVASMNGKHIVKESITVKHVLADKIGKKLAEKILQKSAPWYTQPE